MDMLSSRMLRRYVVPIAGAVLIVLGAVGFAFQLSSGEINAPQAGLGGGDRQQVASLDGPARSQVVSAQSILEPSVKELQPVRVRVKPEVIEGGADTFLPQGSGDTFPVAYALLAGTGLVLLAYSLARAKSRLLRPGLGVLAFAFLVGAFGGTPSPTALAEDATITQWPAGSISRTPPVSVLRAADGTVWYTAVVVDATSVPAHIGRLDPVTNTRTTWTLPFEGNRAFGVAVDADGNVWFAFDKGVGRLEPATNFFTVWSTPGFVAGTEVILDASGRVWFGATVATGFAARLDPSTNVLTTWPLPVLFPRDIDIDAAGNIWLLTSGQTVRLEPASNVVTRWSQGGHSFGLDPSPSGFVWVTTFSPDLIRLDNTANNVTRWRIEGNQMRLSGIAVAGDGRPYFAEFAAGPPVGGPPDNIGIGRFDPATSTYVEWRYATSPSSLAFGGGCPNFGFFPTTPSRTGCMLRFDASGDLWFVDNWLGRIGRLSLTP